MEVWTTQPSIESDIPAKVRWIVDRVTITLCGVIIIGNAMIILAGIINRDLRRKTSILVASLALADLLVGISISITYSLIMQNERSILVMLFAMIFAHFSGNSAIVHLAIIAADRFISVFSPLRYAAIKTKLHVVMVIFCWSFGLIAGVLAQDIIIYPGFQGVKMVNYLNFMTYFSICVLYGALYGYIGFTARKHRNNIRSQVPRQKSHLQNKATQVLMTVVGACCLLWCPHNTLMLYELITNDRSMATYYSLFLLPGVANSAVNIFIYSFMKKEFRDTFMNLLPWRTRKRIGKLRGRRNTVWTVQEVSRSD